MDYLTTFDNISSVRPLMASESRRQSIRLLSVFGNNGAEVIFATIDDKVYGFGHNRYGLLGLSTNERDISRPQLNRTLSGRQVVNIYWSYDSCFGRTSTGQWYGWGYNVYGSLGIGKTGTECVTTPVLIAELSGLDVVAVACGGKHTLLMTSDRLVYGWGDNNFGQLGDKTFNNCFAPKLLFNRQFVSISCGLNHSIGLTDCGQLYTWGINEKGQLGCHPDCEPQPVVIDHKYSVRNQPKPLVTVADGCSELVASKQVVVKAVCGPDYTLILTASGSVYGFGYNTWGLIRNAMKSVYYLPICLADNNRFCDIAASFLGRLSIGVTLDGVYYFWGREPNVPEYESLSSSSSSDPQMSTEVMIDEMYARYSRTNKALKTFILKELDTKTLITTTTTDVLNDDDVYDSGDENQSTITTALRDVNSLIGKPIIDRPLVSSREATVVVNQVIKSSDNNNKSQSISDNSFVSIFMDNIFSSFNSSVDSDVVFIIDGQHIHCHQTVLRLRNKMFWQKCRSVAVEVVNNNSNNNNNNMKTVETIDEIHITTYSYDTFYEFVRYLYGFEPEINDSNCKSLIKLGKVYDEDLLIDRCIEYLIKN